jgi:hypothetical protein
MSARLDHRDLGLGAGRRRGVPSRPVKGERVEGG